jgi:hypothetical protein
MQDSVLDAYLKGVGKVSGLGCQEGCLDRCKGGSFLLNSADPAYQYITQKRIQNTVRVPSSLYTMNVGALANYQSPSPVYGTGALWNNMSDRAVPHVQVGSGGTLGSSYHGSSLRRTQTRDRPGAQTPGGAGVDIKHGSYYRYLNKLKGGKLLRRGPVPATFGAPIPFNRAFPVYGGKTVKTAIVSNCSACICTREPKKDSGLLCNEDLALKRLYRLAFDCSMIVKELPFEEGGKVYARISLEDKFEEAVVISYDVVSQSYLVRFTEGSGSLSGMEFYLEANRGYIIPYFPCYCQGNSPNDIQSQVYKFLVRECAAIAIANGTNTLKFFETIYPLIYNFSGFNFSNIYETIDGGNRNYAETVDEDLLYNQRLL